MSFDVDKRIKELVSAGVSDADIEKIIADEEEITNLFDTVTVSLQTAVDNWNKGDMASLNVAVDNVNNAKKHLGELSKKLDEKKSSKETPGLETTPVDEEVIEEPVDEPVPSIEEEV